MFERVFRFFGSIFKVVFKPPRASVRVSEDGVEYDVQKPEAEITIEPDAEGDGQS
jgi:hypothetical protein